MPIAILVDVSLSMLAPLESASLSQAAANFGGDSSGANRRMAALLGVSNFLDDLESNNRQEYVGVAAFSDTADTIEFTKDYLSLKESLTKSGLFEIRTKSDIVEALRTSFYRCVAVWGSNVLCHVVVVTDCAGCNPDFERTVNSVALLEGKDTVEGSSLSNVGSALANEFFELIRRGMFTCHVVCVNESNSTNDLVRENILFYKKFVEFFDHGGSFRFIDESSTNPSVSAFRKLSEELSTPSTSTLVCGNFAVPVDIVPALKPIRKENDFDIAVTELGKAITIIGFLKPSELGSPPITSRHLLLASKRNSVAENLDPTKLKSADEEKSNPNFCVLLHGAMKVEDMVAVCEIGSNWYGFIYHLPNSKRSNLVLHCFEPGTNAVPWLGALNKFSLRPYSIPPAPTAGAAAAAAATPAAKSPFPITFKTKPSYAGSNSNWIHTYGIQADIQKMLRYARKLPEKEAHFHQELSRICNEALALGFTEMFTILARLLEKEIVSAGSNAPHVAVLKSAINTLLSGRMKFGDPMTQFAK